MALFGNRKKKDSDKAPILPKTDLALTLATFGLFLANLLLFVQAAAYDAVAELGVAMVATSGVIAACKTFFPVLGRRLSTKESLDKPRNLRKFVDQSWQLVVHSCMTAIEVQLLNDNGWEWWNNPKTVWDMEMRGEACPTALRRLYLAQLAVWFVTAFSHKFIEAKHNDYFLMYSHHVVTLGLVTLSYFNGWTPIGLTVLFIHDSSDIVVDVLKMVNYLGLDGSSGTFLAEAAFVLNLVTWVLARMWFFSTKVIYATLPYWNGTGIGLYPMTVNYFSWGNACRWLLLSLLFMHCWWYYLFFKILYRLTLGSSGHDAGREYEGSSDSECEEVDQTKKMSKSD